MTRRRNTYTYILRLALSLAVSLAASAAQAQSKIFSIQKDSVPVMRGFAVSFDIAGPIVLALSDYGEYEAALRLNLHDQYFPIVEVGYGKAEHHDDVTELYYKTQAPYFRVGCDLNVLKNKHSNNRLYAGLRYAYTSYKVDMARETFQDPVWQWDTSFSVEGDPCRQHWMEAVIGLDTKIVGPLHVGWTVRYKVRLSHKDSSAGNTWYVPGYGKYGDTRIGANFNVIIDI